MHFLHLQAKAWSFENEEDDKLRKIGLMVLAEQAHAKHNEQIKYGEAKVRKICAARGLDWDAMTEEERIDFIDDLVHEDRECN